MEIPFRELQHCNTATHSANKIRKRKIIAEKIKLSCEVFVDRNGNVVPLHHIQDVMRVWAAAQQISSKLGSAFALHHTWHCNRKRHANEAVEARKPIGSGSQTI